MPDQDKPKDYDPTEAADEVKRRDGAAAWKERNAEAIKGYNKWVERDGLPSAKFRQF